MLLGLADAGAHVGQTMDASAPTYLLTYWVRERGALSLEDAVRRLTSDTAATFGIRDRGVLREGAFADLNVIDWDALALPVPEFVHDFPHGAGRFVQGARGLRRDHRQRPGLHGVRRAHRRARRHARPRRSRLTPAQAVGIRRDLHEELSQLFSPRNSMLSASGARSSPSTIVSRQAILPSVDPAGELHHGFREAVEEVETRKPSIRARLLTRFMYQWIGSARSMSL